MFYKHFDDIKFKVYNLLYIKKDWSRKQEFISNNYIFSIEKTGKSLIIFFVNKSNERTNTSCDWGIH